MNTKMIRLIVLAALTGIMVPFLSAQQPGYNNGLALNLQNQKSLHSSTSEILLEEVVNLNITNVSIEQALTTIAKAKDLKLMYGKSIMPSAEKRVTLDNKAMSLYEALWHVLEGTDLQFAVSSSRQLVLLKKNELETIDAAGVFQETVRGTVVDAATGESLPGVNILVQGTTTGANTNMNGEFELTVPSLNETLIITFVGYERQEIAIGGRTLLNIALVPMVISGDELVVIGYGTQRKSDLTGTVTSISRENLNQGAITNVDETLIGRISGAEIRQTTGEPGGGLSIRVRGPSSISAGNEPLYVVDGLPIDNSTTIGQGGGENPVFSIAPTQSTKNPLNTLDPSNIASIEILKDASATAIYGARGANGVILITTKRGFQGRARVDYSYSGSFQSTEKRYDILSTREYMEMRNTFAAELGQAPAFSQGDFQTLPDLDYQDMIFRDTFSQSHNLSLSGGNEGIRYNITGGFHDMNGLVIENAIKRYNLSANLDNKISNSFDASISLNISQVQDNTPALSGTLTSQAAPAIAAAILYDPTLPLRNEDGSYFNSSDLLLTNPVSLVHGVQNDLNTNRVHGLIGLRYSMSDALTHQIKLGIDKQDVVRDTFVSTDTFLGSLAGGQARLQQLSRDNLLLEYTANFTTNIFNENVQLTALGGTTYEEYNSKNFFAFVESFPSDVLGTNNLNLGDPERVTVGSNAGEWRILSYFGRLNFNIYDKFLVTGTFRADGSSRFGANNRYAYFPSAAVAWRISEESFVPDLFNDLKLRLSWGLVGNQEIGNYLSAASFSNMMSGVIDGSAQTSTGPTRVPNPNLKWEQTEQYNVGLDVNLWQDRIEASFDYYIKNTKDMLLSVPLPQSSGFGGQIQNVGSMRNSGFEAELVTRNINRPDFQWTTRLNFSTLSNEVTNLGDRDKIIFDRTVVQVGQPLNSYYGYRITGIYQTAEEIANSAQPNAKPGYPIYEDVNGDGVINQDDMVILGNPYADFQFGIGNTFNYKNFNLGIFVHGKVGNDLWNGTAQKQLYAQTFMRNRNPEHFRNRWTPNNRDTKWPSGVETSSYGSENVSLFVEDASYIRLQSISLGYNVPVANIAGLRSATVSISGSNLLTITNYSGVNPDANILGQNNARIDYATYPLARTVTLGLQLSF